MEPMGFLLPALRNLQHTSPEMPTRRFTPQLARQCDLIVRATEPVIAADPQTAALR
jgi:hypothetical protein